MELSKQLVYEKTGFRCQVMDVTAGEPPRGRVTGIVVIDNQEREVTWIEEQKHWRLKK